MTFVQKYCPCGGIILADTEDWKVPMCANCYEDLGEPSEEPASSEKASDK